MAKNKEPLNPFYAPLLLAGIAFVVTACADGVLLVRSNNGYVDGPQSQLLTFMDQRGMQLMFWELAVLGLSTVGIMAVDRWRSKRDERRRGTAADADALTNDTSTNLPMEETA